MGIIEDVACTHIFFDSSLMPKTLISTNLHAAVSICMILNVSRGHIVWPPAKQPLQARA
jgi:hypothetical protein